MKINFIKRLKRKMRINYLKKEHKVKIFPTKIPKTKEFFKTIKIQKQKNKIIKIRNR